MALLEVTAPAGSLTLEPDLKNEKVCTDNDCDTLGTESLLFKGASSFQGQFLDFPTCMYM